MDNEFRSALEDFKLEKDIVGFWQVVARLRELRGNVPASTIHQEVLDFVKAMLLEGFEAGTPPYSATGYRRWDEQKTKALQRIEREWAAIGFRDPGLDQIAWFRPPAMNN